MSENQDDVSNIHHRYSLTLINPSSYYTSLLFSIIAVTLLVVTAVFVYFGNSEEIIRLPAVIAVLLLTQLLDSRFIKHKEYSKALHMSMFGNVMWLLVALSGIGASFIFSEPELSLIYVTEGMFLFASLRIGLFTTALGSSLKKAWMVCLIQPLAMFLVLIPIDLWQSTLMDFTTIVIGVTFLAVATSWSVLTDRAGKPGVKSTHELIQAYLTSVSKNDPSEVENLIEKRSNPHKITTSQIRLQSKDNNDDFRLVLPDVHPGPFHPVGGSNIPYRIYEHLNSSAMVMHSVSDHSLNIPSQTEVENYLKSLTNFDVSNKGITCTEPVTVQINKSRTVGLLFDKTAILFFSLSPYGTEDLPSYVKCEIEQYAKNRKFDRVLVVDCHNAMGEEISKIDSEDLLNSAKSTLDTLMSKKSYQIEFGYANSKDMDINSPDLGLAGLGILCLKINNEKYFLGWADANNMENGVREQVVSDFTKHGFTLLEICTSDTHYTNTAKIRNRNGYYQFGKVAITKNISSWYLDLAKQAESKITPGSFEILEHKSTVMIMGPTIFEDYSKALDRCMKLTKIFLIGSMAFFLSTLTPLF